MTVKRAGLLKLTGVKSMLALIMLGSRANSWMAGGSTTLTTEGLVVSCPPVAVTLQVTPVIAVAPLVIIWAGLDHPERAVVVLATIVAFFPIFSGAVTGLKAADPDLERLFNLYGASRWQKLLRLRLPSAVPYLLEGHKVAAGLAVIGAVIGEFVAGSGGAQGLAWRILEAGNRLQTASMFAALFVLAAMAAVLHALLQMAERRALVWWRGR